MPGTALTGRSPAGLVTAVVSGKPDTYKYHVERKGCIMRRDLYSHELDSPRWQFFFRLSFSRWLMGRLGPDAASFCFAHLE